jgi:hypothetical protein
MQPRVAVITEYGERSTASISQVSVECIIKNHSCYIKHIPFTKF